MSTSDISSLTNESLLRRRSALLEVQADTQRELLEVNRLLKSRFAPINMLPVEILAEILLVVQAYIFALHETNGMVRRWIAVSSVCAHWRTLVVSNPSFWRSIAVQRAPELLSLSLERTIPGLPLSISFADASFPWPSLPLILKDRANDIRTLRFERTRKSFPRHFASILCNCPMPVLDNLFIACEDHYPTPVLPLIHENLPALRSLSMRGLEPIADDTCFSRLQRLTMCETTCFDFAALLNVLVTCTHLGELDLERSVQDWEECNWERLQPWIAGGSSRPVVSLPRVRTLRLAGYYYEAAAILLSYLRFPNATDITVASLTMWTDEPLHIANMLPRSPQDTFSALKTITSVDVVVLDSVYKMHMRGPQGTTVVLSLVGPKNIDWEETEATCAILALPGLCRGAPITSLHFTGRFTDATEFTDPDTLYQPVASIDPEAQRWITLFKEFGSLGTLHITGAGLCRSMWAGLWAASSLSDKQCCGSLRLVILDGSPTFEGYYSYDALELDFQSMWKALSLRAQSGLHLHALTLDVDIYNRSAGMDDRRGDYFYKFQELVTDLAFFPTHLFGDDWKDEDDY